jgi:putative zinc finger/helix-turn-helix YgiT family protein
MKRCTECAAPLPPPQTKLVPYLTSLGLDIQVEANVYTCESCGEVFEGFPRVQDLHRAIVDHITARPDGLRGEEVRFLRKHLGLSSKDLAERMGVDPATVSRWQSSKQQMTASHDRMLRLLARLGPLVEQYEPHPSPNWKSSIALRPGVDGWKARAAG